jgi:hypothetical protein
MAELEHRRRIAKRLEELEDESGTLLVDTVLADARDPASPLHDLYEWDPDTLVLTALRERTREIIRVYGRAYEEHTERNDYPLPKSLPVSIYVRDPDREFGYISVSRLATDRDRAQRALLHEFRVAQATLARAIRYAGVLGVGAEVEALARQLGDLLESVRGDAGGPG